MTSAIPTLLQIFGIAVAMVTGSVGCVFAARAYFRDTRNRVLEQQLRFRMDLKRTEFKCGQLQAAMTHGRQSRMAVLAATGHGQSGYTVQFKQWVDSDLKSTVELTQQLTAIAANPDPDDIGALVARTAEVHGVEVEVQSLADKYKKFLEEDDADRKRIADRHEPPRR